MKECIKTKFGNATINPGGYYRITSRKEGNHNKLLHKLVWEDWYGKPVPEGYDIHHINGIKTDNRIQNLQCVERGAHRRFHHKGNNYWLGKKHSKETRNKMSENHPKYWLGKNHSYETKYKLSRFNNSTGYFRVTKQKDSRCKKGFIWCYQYYNDDGKRKKISSVNICKLEEKVKTKALPWRKL